MVINLSKGDQLEASNQVQSINSKHRALRDDETFHQLSEHAKIVKVDPNLVKAVQDEAIDQHA
jgi:hypothetical protein